MFIIDDKQQKYELTLSRLNFSNTNKIGKIAVEDNFIFWQTSKTYNNNVAIDYHDDFKMKYLDLKPGAVSFLAETCGTPRTGGRFSQRKALNLRIVIKNEDGSIMCTGNIGSFDPLKHKLINNRLYNVKRYDLSGLY